MALPPEDDRTGELGATVGNLERLCSRLEQAEQHFKRLTDECQTVLSALVAVDRRHSAAIASLNERLGDWCNLEGKLLEESSRRIERFERGVSHEWMVLRRLNEEPIAELREQADALRRTCLEAARLTRLRLESAEHAQASQAEDIDRRLAEWTRQLLEAQRQMADGRPAASAIGSAPAGVEPWSFEGVAQLHQEMRSGSAKEDSERAAVLDAAPEQAPAARTVSEPPAEEERQPPEDAPPEQGPRRTWALAFGGASLVALLVFLVLISRGPGSAAPPVETGPRTGATPGSAAAVQPATDALPTATVRAEPDPRMLEAQRAGERAAVMVDILAAPDLRRYALGGLGPTPRAYAQVLWSRTRGLAVTASRLPAAPPGSTYQVWVRNASGVAAAGLLAPDANGRAGLVVVGPLKLPQPGVIRITIEPAAGSPRPTGESCLVGGPTA